jgi:hypothetical protein
LIFLDFMRFFFSVSDIIYFKSVQKESDDFRIFRITEDTVDSTDLFSVLNKARNLEA